MDDFSVKIGQRIKNFRKARSLTQLDLADRIGKGKGVVSKYESGAVVMDMQTLAEIADALELPISALVADNTPVDKTYSLSYTYFTTSDHLYVYNLRNNEKKNKVFITPSRIVLAPEETQADSFEKAPIKAYWYTKLGDIEDLSSADSVIPGMLETYESFSLFTFMNTKRHNFKTMMYVINFINDRTITEGLVLTIQTYPQSPVSIRNIVSTKPIKDEQWLIEQLTLNKEDLSLIKRWNGLPIRSGLLNRF